MIGQQKEEISSFVYTKEMHRVLENVWLEIGETQPRENKI